MDACFLLLLLLALEEGPPLSARLRGGAGVGDIFPISLRSVKLHFSFRKKQTRASSNELSLLA